MSKRNGPISGIPPTDPPLTTKLYVPPARPDLVPRPHLTERLNRGLVEQGDGFTRRLSLISAPAGFGKTTLATEWLHSAPRPFTWLSLDEGDNDPARFLTYLVTALQVVDATIGRSAQAMLQAPQPPPLEVLLTSLINDIAATSIPFILVLDDYHVIQTLAIHQLMIFLVEHQPRPLHLAIVSREDPPLPLARMRARGHTTEIRQDDLRFKADEAAELLQRVMQLQLSGADVVALHQRTEGWVAGLHLAALSLRDRTDVRQFIDAFAGSHRYILDYLIEEVFRRQSETVQDFLLRTSILERFTAPLCDAVAERSDSRQVLISLEHANLFIVPLDETRQWYRYHRLFADLLRHRLDIEAPAEVVRLHRLASGWYSDNGLPDDAISHALAAGDWPQAAALIIEVENSMVKRGEVMTLLTWLRQLPEEELRSRPALCLSYSWALTLTGQLKAAEMYLEVAERTIQGHGGPDAQGALLPDILSAQAFIARSRGEHERTIELSRRALSLLPPADLDGRSAVAVNLGIAQWSAGNLEEAERALREAEQAARQSGNHYARLTALGFLGAVRGAQGRLHEAARWLREAVQTGGGSPPIALAHDTLGALLYEWNDLEAAANHLRRGGELGARSGNVEIQIGGCRILARIRQARGDVSGALEALQEAHQLAREKDVPPLMRVRNAACHVQIALAQGDLPTALRWAEQVTDAADGSRFYPLLGLTPARLLLAQGKKAAAAQELGIWYDTAVEAGWWFGAVEVRALQALAAPSHEEGQAFLADALTMAEPEGYVRTFVDKGPPMADLLRRTAVRGTSTDYAAKLLAAFEMSEEAERDARPQPLVEPLSERELEVVALLADGLTYQEIALELFISVNTVKSHLKSIYGKLGVHSRHEAAAKAEALALLS